MKNRSPLVPLLLAALPLTAATAGCISVETTGGPGASSLGFVPALDGDLTFTLELRTDGDYDLYGQLGGALFTEACDDFVFTANVGGQAVNTSDGGMASNLTLPGQHCEEPRFSTSVPNPLDGQRPLGDLELLVEVPREDRLVTELPPLSAADQLTALNYSADQQSTLLPSPSGGAAAVQAWDREVPLIFAIPDVAHDAREIRLVIDRLKLVDRDDANNMGVRVEAGSEATTGATLQRAEASPEDFVVHHVATAFDAAALATVDGDELHLALDLLTDDYGLFQIQIEAIDDLTLGCPAGSSCDARLTRLSEPVIVELLPVPADELCIGACG